MKCPECGASMSQHVALGEEPFKYEEDGATVRVITTEMHQQCDGPECNYCQIDNEFEFLRSSLYI